jgi:DNA-binding transcriptional LysR family regulator
MLYDPGLPDEFMNPFWLGDVRPAHDARLVSIVARDSRTVLEQVLRGNGVTVLLPWQADTAPKGVRVLPLLGVGPIELHAATRVGDHRSVVLALIKVLRAVLARRSTTRGAQPA